MVDTVVREDAAAMAEAVAMAEDLGAKATKALMVATAGARVVTMAATEDARAVRVTEGARAVRVTEDARVVRATEGARAVKTEDARRVETEDARRVATEDARKVAKEDTMAATGRTDLKILAARDAITTPRVAKCANPETMTRHHRLRRSEE